MTTHQWLKHIENQLSSGLSNRDYCKAHNLKESLFYKYRRAYKEQQDTAANLKTKFHRAVISTPQIASDARSIRLNIDQNIALEITDQASLEKIFKIASAIFRG